MMQQFKTGLSNSRVKRICKQSGVEGFVTFDTVDGDTFQRLKKCLTAGFGLIMSNCQFERGRIIGLKEAGWANRRITRHMGRSDAVIRRFWQEWVVNGRFQLHNDSS
ncbi:HTH_Tnp_Tc3_2 domain-containing protein [Trichonephila clavipes]|nr:HTH_Tnp_Tc3_2 domain-containing protein [Trichonephila clavipes]